MTRCITQVSALVTGRNDSSHTSMAIHKNNLRCLVIWRLAAVAVCCIHTFLECLLSARFALPRRLDGDAVLAVQRSGSSASARWELTHRTHIWLLLRLRRNGATRGACWKVTILAAPCCIISRSLSRRTEGVRRLRRTAQIAFHCLRIGLHVRVAAPTLG